MRRPFDGKPGRVFAIALALWVSAAPFVLAQTVVLPTDGTDSSIQDMSKRNLQIKSRSGKSLGADSKRPRVNLQIQEEVSPETITSKGLRGKASFYSPRFQGRKTASGEIFSNKLFTAASNLIPLGTLVAVKRPDTNLCVIVKINDRMHPRHRARVIDLSHSAAKYLDMVRDGVVKVQIMKVPSDVTEGTTIDCAMGYELEEDCENCTPPLQFIDD